MKKLSHCGTVEEKVAEVEADPVKHNAGNNLVGCQTECFKPSDDYANTCSACGTYQTTTGICSTGEGQGQHNNGQDSTNNVLTLSANVKEANTGMQRQRQYR